jgi:biotin synthase
MRQIIGFAVFATFFVALCGIVNARSGACSMDCAFCAQSASREGNVDVYPLIAASSMTEASEHAADRRALRFGIVTSGQSVEGEQDVKVLCEAVKAIEDRGRITPCASLGLLSMEAFAKLRDAGLRRYHHNIETAPSYYPEVCSTRRPEDSLRTLENARKAGLEICCGGIFGLGETPEQRVEFLTTLADIAPNSVPLNFYVPVPGARLGRQADLTPMACLRLVALARLMMPDAEIRVAAGREPYFRSAQALLFMAGADGMMVGDFLTLKGGDPDGDLRLIKDAGMEILEA